MFGDLPDLNTTRMQFDLQTGAYSKNDGSYKRKINKELVKFEVGDRFTLEAVGTKVEKFYTDEEAVSSYCKCVKFFISTGFVNAFQSSSSLKLITLCEKLIFDFVYSSRLKIHVHTVHKI